MGVIIRGVRNVLRNPLRLLVVVLLLGASLMFVAAMVSLNSSAQQQLANVHQEVGTAITINYATNDSQTPGQQGGQGATLITRGGNFFQQNTTPIPNSAVATVEHVPGVVSVEESLRRSDSGDSLKTSTIQTPDGRSITLPAMVSGISTGATHFTLPGGSTPTMVSGRTFQASDANANVAMMSQSMANVNNLKVGSTFQMKNTTFTLIGIYTTDQAATIGGNTVVLPMATMQRVFSVNGVDSITAYAQSYEQVDAVASRLRSALGSAFDVTTEASTYSSTINALNVAQNSIQMALVISIVTATLVIIFAIFITVRERTSEIGILKAVGASHWQVIRQFWGEVLTLSGVASILAVILLATLGPVISQAFNITPQSTTPATAGPGKQGFVAGGGGRFLFSQAASKLSNVHLASATLNAQTLLIIVGLGMALAVLTSIIPSWYVARIKPAEVLRRG
jgi:putative ABC transport system permease protein